MRRSPRIRRSGASVRERTRTSRSSASTALSWAPSWNRFASRTSAPWQETAGRDRLDAGELDRWLAALNDLRLVLGTRLDVSEDEFADGFDPNAPHAYELAVYAFLTWLQEAAIQAASSHLGGGASSPTT